MSNPLSSILHPRHVLVTGGAGFIGSHLVERLLNDGKTVVVVDDLSTGDRANLSVVAQNPNLRVIEAKISSCAELPQLVAGAESIYHLAAAVGVDLVVKSPIHVLETNLHETEVLLETAAPHRVPLLIASTSEVYGKSEKPAFSEEDDLLIGPPHHARWSYACSKLMDEFLALAYAKEKELPVVIVRLFNTVGPRQTGQYGMVLPRFITAAKQGESLRVFGDGQQSRCFCYVLDTVEALVRLQSSSAARGEIFNIGGIEEVTILQLAQRVIETLGSQSQIEFIPYSEAYAPGFDDMRRRKPVVEKLKRVTGFSPQTSLDQIIQRTAESLNRSAGLRPGANH
ncbi:MAG TPA: NAD-dependent epimerase/dehydratase family protein [Verrucomicrobiae bacterium]|nr:NAD-dependent epimerase/dehydratase family protein [Verrucomicrobiae bacterium]